MSILFKKPPLLEIVAELKWSLTPPVQVWFPTEHGMVAQPSPLLEPEELFGRFTTEMAKIGFGRSERLMPANFTLPVGTVVSRYFETPTDDRIPSSKMLQIGTGVFTANALPPYMSWHDFAPTVERGVNGLLAAFGTEEKRPQFTGLSLRYINAFKEDLIGSMGAHEFVTEILGFQLELPNEISKHIQAGKRANPNLTINFPLNDTTAFNIMVAEGAIQNERAIIMDMTVSHTASLFNPKAADIMWHFALARDVIHDVFTSTTGKLHGAMEAS